MNDWLSDTFNALAASGGVDGASVPFADDDAATLLAIARAASHDSGDRTNAPLLCYLLGRLMERSPTITLEQLHATVAGRAGDQS
jgi:hypothetical protein